MTSGFSPPTKIAIPPTRTGSAIRLRPDVQSKPTAVSRFAAIAIFTAAPGPAHGTIRNVAANVPTIDPIVFHVYTPATLRPTRSSPDDASRQVNGKAAPMS